MAEVGGWWERARGVFARSSLRVAFAWTAFGNAYYMASQWALLVVLAKATSPEVVGRFSHALALTAPVVSTSMMGLRQVMVTDARGEHGWADYLALRLATTAGAALFIVGVALRECDTAEARVTVLLVGLAKLFEAVSDLYQAKAQRAERMDRVALSLFAKGTLALALMGALVLGTGSLVAGAAGIAAANGLVLFLWDIPRSAGLAGPGEEEGAPGTTKPRWGAMAALVRVSAPITASVLLTSVGGSMPRWFLEQHHGHREVGYYAAASAPLLVMSFLPGVLSQSTLARAARYYADGEHRAFLQLNLRMTAFNLAMNGGIALACALLGEQLLALMFTREYAHLRWVMVIFTLSQVVAVAATVGTQLMSAARMFRLQLLNAVVALVALHLASRALVPTMGVRGSAWAEVLRNSSATVLPVLLTVVYLVRRAWITGRDADAAPLR